MAGVSVTDVFNTEVTAIARTYIEQQPIDVIFDGNLLLSLLFREDKFPGSGAPGEGRVRTQVGGRKATIPVAYNRSSNVQSFKRADTVSTNVDEVATIQEAQFSYYTDYAALTWQEFIENRGEAARFSIISSRLRQALMTIKERVNTDLFSTGDAVSVGNGGKNIIGIQHLLNATQTSGTVWGLDRSVYTWHRATAVAAGDTWANVGLAKLLYAYISCSGENAEDPLSCFITTITMFSNYHTSVSGKQQITMTTIGDMGFPSLAFMGRPIFWSANALANTWWGLNMKYGVMILQDGAKFNVREEPVTDKQVMKGAWRILFGGQFGFERMDRQLVLTYTG